MVAVPFCDVAFFFELGLLAGIAFLPRGVAHSTRAQGSSPSPSVAERKGAAGARVAAAHPAIADSRLPPASRIALSTSLRISRRKPAASSGMELLEIHRIARELTGKRRNRLFVYERYLDVLNEGTEPP